MFKFWSTTQPDATKELHPDLGLRDWDDLSNDEKDKIWHYLKNFFVSSDKNLRTFFAVYCLNENHKYRSYGKHFLHDQSLENARMDFEHIFKNESQHVLFELISCFCQAILFERSDKTIWKRDKESDKEYRKRLNEWRYEDFDKFAERLNDVFEHFGINVVLTRQGFIPRQDKKITKEIYEPVLQFLSIDKEKWEPVNRDLKDAFKDYQLKTVDGYSSCITHTISAIEAFLQIILYGETGRGTLGSLISEAQKKNLVPNDNFTSQIFKNTEAIFARERKETGDAHPKKEYANERNARTLLNLAMIFLQHCMESNYE